MYLQWWKSCEKKSVRYKCGWIIVYVVIGQRKDNMSKKEVGVEMMANKGKCKRILLWRAER